MTFIPLKSPEEHVKLLNKIRLYPQDIIDWTTSTTTDELNDESYEIPEQTLNDESLEDMDTQKLSKFSRDRRTDRRTDRPTDRRTDGPTDRRTDRPTDMTTPRSSDPELKKELNLS